jgi:hypothetical protein
LILILRLKLVLGFLSVAGHCWTTLDKTLMSSDSASETETETEAKSALFSMLDKTPD